MIRAVFFDLDGTLYDRDAVMQKLVQEQFGVFRESLGDIGETQFVQRILQLDAHGHGEEPFLYERVVYEWGLGPELAARLVRYFREHYDRHCSLSDDVLATLQNLRASGKKLGVITNGPIEWQQKTLAALGLDSFFDAVLISEREGLRKPDRHIFARALERCDVLAAEALFVGDHPGIDVAGAQAAGLIAAWKWVPYWELTVEGALTIDRLSDVLPLCLNR
jgi:putative hydrolase of the HAD superfamily